MRNVIIVGSGPSGYAAGIYLSRARLEPLLFSGEEIGGQLMYTTEVENYPGFSEGINGPELMMEMRQQAERFGTEIIDKRVTAVQPIDGGFEVSVGKDTYQAKTVLITTGAVSRKLGLENEDSLMGRGLSTCAVCDAAFFRDKVAYVIGGGDSAMEDALALTKHAKEVYVAHRRDSFRASEIMQERVLNHDKITVLWNTEVTRLNPGENGMLQSIVIKNRDTGEEEERPADGIFYAIGHIPSTDFLGDLIRKRGDGYIITALGLDKESVAFAQEKATDARVPYLTQTSVDGIFAAGDCVDFHYRQAVTAAAMGTMGALDIEHWLEEHAE